MLRTCALYVSHIVWECKMSVSVLTKWDLQGCARTHTELTCLWISIFPLLTFATERNPVSFSHVHLYSFTEYAVCLYEQENWVHDIEDKLLIFPKANMLMFTCRCALGDMGKFNLWFVCALQIEVMLGFDITNQQTLTLTFFFNSFV